MTEIGIILLGLGGILLLGMTTDFIGRKTPLPRVTLLLLFGVLMGDEGFQLIPAVISQQFEFFSTIALLVIGFLLGGQFDLKNLKVNSKPMFWVSACAALFTVILVFAGMQFTALPISVVVVLACIASATAPAPIVDIILETKDNSAFSRLLLQITAIDDVWAMILFSMAISFALVDVNYANAIAPFIEGVVHIVGAVFLGVFIGLPASVLTGRIKPGQPTLVETLGLVLFSGGLAIYLDVSFLITVMVLGATIANIAQHHEYPFHEIENIEWPFMVIFFVLAGASLKFELLNGTLYILIAYVVLRIFGKCLGAYVGALLSQADVATKRWMGLALLPQAGVEIGMALIAANQFPQHAQAILSIVITATVFFEIVGPPLSKLAINRAQKLNGDN
ncbi:cation:proton antiporter [Aliiglaciecola sp. M165]|uniref:cation:proton antiporter n=1 Tax=Aliiglaciecola sp. M165 TaxID=2593649 RepID=UPI001180AB83|nr:cation:proton antiporter [Aliiglaciecola sp. M165]TRY29890.1 cation:proton antiporter [Aliiglaciecola sp. M165]